MVTAGRGMSSTEISVLLNVTITGDSSHFTHILIMRKVQRDKQAINDIHQNTLKRKQKKYFNYLICNIQVGMFILKSLIVGTVVGGNNLNSGCTIF